MYVCGGLNSSGASLTLIQIRNFDHANAQEELLKFERIELFKEYKFGVLLIREEQTQDDEFFSNSMSLRMSKSVSPGLIRLLIFNRGRREQQGLEELPAVYWKRYQAKRISWIRGWS